MEPSIDNYIEIILHFFFLFLLFKGWIHITWWFFFCRHNFRFESWKYLFLQLSLGGEEWLVLIDGEKSGKEWFVLIDGEKSGKEWLVLIDGGKRENKLDDCNTFEKMEMNRYNLGIWNLKETSQTLLSLVSKHIIGLGAKLEI